MAVCAAIITIPAYFPNSAGIPVAFYAVVSIAVIGLYIAYVIPIYLRWRNGRPVPDRARGRSGTSTSG